MTEKNEISYFSQSRAAPIAAADENCLAAAARQPIIFILVAKLG